MKYAFNLEANKKEFIEFSMEWIKAYVSTENKNEMVQVMFPELDRNTMQRILLFSFFSKHSEEMLKKIVEGYDAKNG